MLFSKVQVVSFPPLCHSCFEREPQDPWEGQWRRSRRTRSWNAWAAAGDVANAYARGLVAARRRLEATCLSALRERLAPALLLGRVHVARTLSFWTAPCTCHGRAATVRCSRSGGTATEWRWCSRRCPWWGSASRRSARSSMRHRA